MQILRFLLLTLSAGGMGIVGAQCVSAPMDLIAAYGYLGIPVRYKEVPTGICELDAEVKRLVDSWS